MTVATLPLTAAPSTPPPAPAPAVSTAPDAVSAAPSPVSTAPRAAVLWRLLLGIAVIGGLAVAGIGFSGSYSALRALAVEKGFGWFAPWFPIGVDAGIIVALATDLYLVRRGLHWPVLRPLAHVLTLATVWFNAASGPAPVSQDPVAGAMHAVMPILFVSSVEAARFLVIRTARLEAGHDGGVPLARWLLAPWPTWRLYRRMRVWGLASYAEAVARDQEMRVYRVLLEREHGSVRAAPPAARLPVTMARYGLTVDQALALPQQEAERAQRRREVEESRQVEAEARAAERAAELERVRLRSAGSVEAARLEVDAETGQARTRAHAAQTAAERAAAAEGEAAETAAAAEARAAAAEADRRTAEERKRAAETDRAAAETERAAAEVRAAAVETERVAAEEGARTEAAEAAAARSTAAAAEERKRAIETEQRAAETEQRAAEARAAAAEADALAQLSPREHTVRRVARMMLTAGQHVDLPLASITAALGVSVGTASTYRQEAAELIAGGYCPGGSGR